MFYSENINYENNFYATDLYVSVCRGVFITQQKRSNKSTLSPKRMT